MFGLFKRKKPYEQQAWSIFDTLQGYARQPEFYTELNIPDTTDGRFDLLIVHMFMLIHRLKDELGGPEFSQSVFDAAFQNIDQGFREIGVGDMGVPKRMKKLMLGFNGRIHAYDEALAEGDDDKMKDAISRNVYYDAEEGLDIGSELNKMLKYINTNIEYLQSQNTEAIMNGDVEFKTIAMI